MDKDRGLYVTLKEFSNGLDWSGIHCEPAEYQQLFKRIDVNGDRQLELACV